MNVNVKNNFLNFISYSQFYYPSMFKFVPLQNKQCFVKRHNEKDVGIWNDTNININNVIPQLKTLVKNNNNIDIGIHTSKDVCIIDIDCFETDDGTKIKLSDRQKNVIINSFGTLAQKTGGGVHLFFQNDMLLEIASTGNYFEVNGFKLKYDIRGLSKAFVAIKENEKSFTFNAMKNISNFKNILDIHRKIASKKIKIEVKEKDISDYYEYPDAIKYEEELKKLYEIKNIIGGKNLQEIIDSNVGEGNRHPTFTQILLRGASEGVNVHVIYDVIEQINNTLAEALNEKRLNVIYKYLTHDNVKQKYQQYENRRTNMSKTINPNLRMYVNFVTKLDNGKTKILGSTQKTKQDGTKIFTNYEIMGDFKNVFKKGDLIDAQITKISWQKSYKEEGKEVTLKTPKFAGYSFEPQIVNENTFKGTPFGLTVKGQIVNDSKRVNADFNSLYLKNSSGGMLQLNTPNEFKSVKGLNVILPITSFNSFKKEDGTYRGSSSISKFITNENINKFVQDKEIKKEQEDSNVVADSYTSEKSEEDNFNNFSQEEAYDFDDGDVPF